MGNLRSYPKLNPLGHREAADLLKDEVIVEEKVDGSQFSFGKKDGKLVCQSKGAQIDTETPNGQFKLAVDMAIDRLSLLREGFTYRGEYLQKPKHNTLKYARTPVGNVIIFDVETDDTCSNFLSPEGKAEEAIRLGLECVPVLFRGLLTDFRAQVPFEKESCLGGVNQEGVVVKNYTRFGADKKPIFCKVVSAEFKEVHSKDWRERNPVASDVIAVLTGEYKTEARWEKAFQHLRDEGKLVNEMKDIAILITEVTQDVKIECEAEIKQKLFDWAWKKMQRALTGGLPEWYKKKLYGDPCDTSSSESLSPQSQDTVSSL